MTNKRGLSTDQGPTETKKLKKGITGKDSVNDCPGRPSDPSTFLDTKNNEQKTAAYVGYTEVAHLRELAVSWPLLKAYPRFDAVCRGLSRKSPFLLILGDEKAFTDVNPDHKWPLSDDNDATIRSRHMAAIILQVEKDLKDYRFAPQNNSLRNHEYQKKFKDAFPDLAIASFIQTCPPPELGPLENEHRLESINRCWALLTYMRYSIQAKSWNSRFSKEGVAVRVSVAASHIPGWMRPTDTIVRPEIKPQGEVAVGDNLNPISVTVVWERTKKFDGYEELVSLLETAEEKGLAIPNNSYLLPNDHDPRLFKSIFSFKDCLRRIYRCQEIGMDIERLRLDYIITSDEEPRSDNILVGDWDETLSTFDNKDFSRFSVKVLFAAIKNNGVSLFESFEPLPALTSFFTTVESDVTVNAQNVNKDLIEYFKSIPASNSNEVGHPPEPKTFDSREAFIAYYSGFDVETEEGKMNFQRKVLSKLSRNANSASLTQDQLPKDLAKEDQQIISEIQKNICQESIEEESFPDKDDRLMQAQYYTFQRAFSGTQSRAGPPLDICMRLLLATEQANGLYKSELLKDFVKSEFYNYQLAGAVGVILKLYGSINAELLLSGTGQLYHPQANDVRDAARQLRDIRVHGVILADETGFGKTKQCLLAAVLHSLLYTETDDNGDNCYRPMLLVVPPTLIRQWVQEIYHDWPYLRPLLSYEDQTLRSSLDIIQIPQIAMREFPSLDAFPPHLQYIFNCHARIASRVIIVTSYMTHKNRTGQTEVKHYPGKSFDPPRFHPETNEEIFEEKPRTETIWKSGHTKRYSLLIADEAQKVKNPDTDTWCVLRVQQYPKTILATATPMFNAAQDLVGLVGLLWPAAREDLYASAETDSRLKKVLQDIEKSRNDPMKVLSKLDLRDPARLELMNTESLAKIFAHREKLHLRVAARFQPLLDLVCVQRSQGSQLNIKSGAPIKLGTLFKKIHYHTAKAQFDPGEELEYQMWHREAAKEYVAESKKVEIKIAAPNATVKKSKRDNKDKKDFAAAIIPLRKLAIANFATKLARLNAIMENIGGDTHVTTLRLWRAKGMDAEMIHQITRGKGEKLARTAEDLLKFLTHGSPALRLIFQELTKVKVIEKVNKERYGHHQKLIIGEVVPANAFLLETVLRACLIDARVFHADLSHQAKSLMVDMFNDAKSSLKVLIMLYDVGAVGLNLHKACNRVLISSIPRSRCQESQLAGRALRITSEFPLTVVRRWTPNSHDQFRGARQAEKAALQLAANAQDSSIKRLIVQLLQKLQPEVDECHQSTAGQDLLEEMTTRSQKRVEEAVETLKGETKGERSQKVPERYGSLKFDKHGTILPHSPITNTTRSDSEDELEFGEENDDENHEEHDDVDSEDEMLEASWGEGLADTADIDIDDAAANFVNETQPDDDTRHKLALLQLPFSKQWSEKDLENELYMRIGLHLLYNKIHGGSWLHLGRSIHLAYLQFPQKVVDRMKGCTEATEKQKKAAMTF
ncbi:uncharacterized protein TRUGW13939_02078 [Talaromyces rugulosus]|uniref:Helicase ATP-binding domain-containing protein n=1 Tax=Talaromyces rugulosus TaxID=121627 RepID=A0A7H8QMA1_TALRU|nr:uncharacterized protein TRUGW13939_02078 [Talaromyces rugulosus]QKX54988.1 hypothetical protein TRUGW13939_02078 [Talaromyces rugulosus]